MLLSQKISNLLRKLGLMTLANYIMNIRYFLLKKIYRFFGIDFYQKIYNDTFYNNKNQEEVLGKTPDLIADFLIKKFNPHSIIDFGCGTGIYLKAFEIKGIEVIGIDASPSASKNFRLDKSKIIIKDITQPIILEKKYDCTICFEVAEHIPQELSESLINNLCQASDLIIFSAAPKGQGGIGHINERDPKFWIDLFKKNNFIFLESETNDFKKYLKQNQTVFWLSQNIMIFKKQ